MPEAPLRGPHDNRIPARPNTSRNSSVLGNELRHPGRLPIPARPDGTIATRGRGGDAGSDLPQDNGTADGTPDRRCPAGRRHVARRGRPGRRGSRRRDLAEPGDQQHHRVADADR